jgi:hypothetical protein
MKFILFVCVDQAVLEARHPVAQSGLIEIRPFYG